MLIDGITLAEGSDVNNLTVNSGTLAERGTLIPTNGELFYQTDNTPGLYIYGTSWVQITTADELSSYLRNDETGTLTGDFTVTGNFTVTGTFDAGTF